jgi:hypothetical protein
MSFMKVRHASLLRLDGLTADDTSPGVDSLLPLDSLSENFRALFLVPPSLDRDPASSLSWLKFRALDDLRVHTNISTNEISLISQRKYTVRIVLAAFNWTTLRHSRDIIWAQK